MSHRIVLRDKLVLLKLIYDTRLFEQISKLQISVVFNFGSQRI